MKKKGTRTILILVIFGIILSSAFYVLIYKKTGKLFLESNDIKARIESARIKNIEMESVRRDIKATLGDYEKIQNIFIEKEGVVDFIQTMESLGKEIGVVVEIESVKDEEFEPVSPTRERLLISFSAEGTRTDTLAFLKLMEFMPHKIDFKRAVLSRGNAGEVAEQDGAASGNWKLTADISVLKAKE
ncbi:MAG TPA: hypothetical protein VEC13_03425 [Candidatus Paceibacterota bacterium]|nr:hypothetical protein [Candidatus Paceibacterota bacterium]